MVTTRNNYPQKAQLKWERVGKKISIVIGNVRRKVIKTLVKRRAQDSRYKCVVFVVTF